METIEKSVAIDRSRIIKRRCLIAVLNVLSVHGFLVGYLDPNSGWLGFAQIALNVVSVALIIAWCYFDAEQRGAIISRRLSLALFFVLVIAFPYYLSKTRTGPAFFKALGLSVLFAVLACGVYGVMHEVGYIVYEAIYL